MEGTAFRCRCGQLRGDLGDLAQAEYTHVRCHCTDCRAAYTYLGQADPGSVGILQTTQDRVHISAGSEHLAVFRHSPRGALRWFAKCCGTPLFFTPLKRRLVITGLNTDALESPDDLGPVQVEAFLPSPHGRPRHRGAAGLVAAVIKRMLANNLSGAWRQTIFFDEAGAPIRAPHILSREERRRALTAVER